MLDLNVWIHLATEHCVGVGIVDAHAIALVQILGELGAQRWDPGICPSVHHSEGNEDACHSKPSSNVDTAMIPSWYELLGRGCVGAWIDRGGLQNDVSIEPECRCEFGLCSGKSNLSGEAKKAFEYSLSFFFVSASKLQWPC